jgi:hypothetical protein
MNNFKYLPVIDGCEKREARRRHVALKDLFLQTIYGL